MSAVILGIDDVQVIGDLYPRLQPNRSKIDDYFDSLDQLPPIVVARGRVLVDGWHRWKAHAQAGRTEIKAVDLGELNDEQILDEAVARNATHGTGLTRNDKRALAVRLWVDGREHAAEIKRLAKLLAVAERTVERWTADVRAAETEAMKRRAWELHQAGWSQRRIAAEVGVTHPTVGEWVEGMRQVSETFQAEDGDGGDGAESGVAPDVPADPEPAADDAEATPKSQPSRKREATDGERAFLEEWSKNGDLIDAVASGRTTLKEALRVALNRQTLAIAKQGNEPDQFTTQTAAGEALARAISLLINFMNVPDDGFLSPDTHHWRVMRNLTRDVPARIQQWKEAANDNLA
jgi:DNA-binding transcriptional regulator YdaS (Cro superfamily)